eukprot:3324211-Amphidinium_carterae.2
MRPASVDVFNRVARALHRLMVRLLGVTTTNYFDDYPLIDVQQLAHNARNTLHEFLSLLGFEVSIDKKKCLAPSVVFAALGAVVDLSGVARLRLS